MTRTIAAVVLLAAMLAASCGDDDDGETAGGGGSSSTAAVSGSTSSGSVGGGAPGGGGAGGGATEITCTGDAPPDRDLCAGADLDGEPRPSCELEVDGGCPTTTVRWLCRLGEGANVWVRSVDTQCDCSGDGADEVACSALPGCVWASPGIDECGDDASEATPVPVAGCYRTACGDPYWNQYGLVGGQCDFDLCDTTDD